jgi:glycosyltransferase involved in cell wall biosynthesis
MKIRYYGPIGRLSGYGRAGVDLCLSLLAAGVELEIRLIERRPEEAKIAFDGGPCQALLPYLRHEYQLTAAPDAIIVHTLPLDCGKIMELELTREPGLDPNIPWIAYTTWEASSPVTSEVHTALTDFQAIWVPSARTQSSFMDSPVDQGVFVVPHAFDPDTLPARRRGHPRSGGRFRFYYVGAWTSRKNPSGLLRAWAMAFTPADEVDLNLHCPGSSQEQYAVALHQTGLLPAAMAPVVFRNELVTDEQYTDIHRAHDCFVTATRGEAWDLPAFDAMLAGRHIIHPRGMGSDDFLSVHTTAALYGGAALPASVDVRVTERMEGGVKLQIVGAQGLSSRSTWLEPDLCALSAMMRRVAADRRRTITTDYDPSDRYGYPAVGKLALAILEDLT